MVVVQFWSTADDQIVVVVVVVVGDHSAAVDSGVACVGSCCGVSGDVAAAVGGDVEGGGGGGEGGEGPRPPHSTSSTIKTFLKIFFFIH